MVKRLWLPLLALLAVCSFAVNAADSEIEQLKKMIQAQNAKIEKLEKAQASSNATASVDKAVASKGAAYLAPDRPDIKGTGLSFTGEFLYWKPQHSNQTYALVDHTGDSYDLYGGTSAALEQEWSPGFRANLSYRLPYDGWDVGTTYTYFRSDAHAEVAGDIHAVLLPQNTIQENDADLAKAEGKLSLDMVDFALSRNFAVSQTFSVKASGGLRMMWLEDYSKVNYFGNEFPDLADGGLGYQATDKINFFGYGIHAALDAELKLRHGFSLVGSAGASLLTGDFKYHAIKGNDENSNGILSLDGELEYERKESIHRMVPVIQIGAGVAWERKLRDNLNFKVSAGYEFTSMFNTYTRTNSTADDDTGQETETHGDLGFHGLTFRVHLDF